MHDRWVGVHSNQVHEEEEEEDNVSRKVNINMDIGNVKHVKLKQVESGYDSSVVSDMSRVKVARSFSQPSHMVRNRLREVREAERNQYLV